MVQATKIDSNITGLSIAEEASIGVLPATPVWVPQEPNSYSGFGSTIKTVARTPITNTRQRKKGVVTDLDAMGGFNTDLTQTNMQSNLQGFFFASLRRKAELGDGINGAVSSVSATQYLAAAGFDAFSAGALVLGSGFAVAANNGLKRVTASNAGSLTVLPAPAVEAAPGAKAKVTAVGVEFSAGELAVTVNGGFPILSRVAGTQDFTTMKLVPGEFIYIGGDAAGTKFASAVNNGWARVRSISADALVLDKTSRTMIADAGAGKTIRLFFGRVLKNEVGTDIVRRTYQLERSLGAADDANPTQLQAEYLLGAVPNEFKINIPTADKITVDLDFVALNSETRQSVEGLKPGNRVALRETSAFNTSSDFSRIKLAAVSQADGAPNPLLTFISSLDISISNNVTTNKAIGVIGGFDASAGIFEVSGSMTAYFSDVSAIAAVKGNSDITLDFAIVAQNAGIVVDLPLLTLGNAQVDIAADRPINIPLSLDAAIATKVDTGFTHTLLMVFFDYLPAAADS